MPQRWSDPGFATPADLAACREMLRVGSRTFFMASLLLPEEVREPAGAVYAFCREADDAVDLGDGGLDALARMHERLDRAYAGRPLPRPVDRAFADTVLRFAIPRALPEALFEGFEWDLRGRRYEELGDVEAYAARVAGTVGGMMAVLMGASAPSMIARACDLGVAMQLSNIARDIGEDARAGRLYLPRRWLWEAGIDPDAWLARPAFTPALASVVQRLLAVADELYVRADVGIERLPRSCRPAIRAARLLYAEIGREVERRGLDSVNGRAMVPAARKLRLLVGAMLRPLTRRPDDAAPALDATHFLVEAVVEARLAAGPPPRPLPWWKLGRRLVWTLDLFERIERRQRVRRSPDRA